MISIWEAEPAWSLPFDPPQDHSGRARALVQAVEDGWLIAMEEGEWGASVWWISSDGLRSERLGLEHVVALLPRGDVVWAPGSDPDMVIGTILRIEKDESSRWQALVIPQTLSAPAEAAVLDGDTLLVATSNSVETVDGEGNVGVLARVDWLNYFPNSLYRSPDGVILVGLNHGVARLVPDAAGSYVEDWLVPPACSERVFVRDQLDCACAGLLPGSSES